MVPYRLAARPAFEIAGRQTAISGPDSAQFGRFWEQARAEGLFARLEQLTGFAPGPQTGGATLGVSRVEADPSSRAFAYMIAVELPPDVDTGDLERVIVPATMWAVFECHGPLPDAIVEAEMFAFMEWLPASGYVHAFAPEMEVYPPSPRGDGYCEFWLPVRPR